MHEYEADLEQHGAEDARVRNDGTIEVESSVSWRTLRKRTDYEYTLLDKGGGVIMLEPVKPA